MHRRRLLRGRCGRARRCALRRYARHARLPCGDGLFGRLRRRIRPHRRARPSVREATLDCGESGSTARFLLPAAAYFLDCATLVGRGRLPARPFAALTDALRANGTAVRGDFLPIAVSGGLHAGVYRMRGDVSSQFFTGLLLALPALGRESSVELTTPLESAPYVALTNAVLRAFGVED